MPCGKCPECRKRRISGWSFRLVQESKRACSAWFVTLTYDTEFVPLTEKGFMNLSKRDVQLFMKRLRKLSPEKLRYYLCGEYGGKSFRPHYHLILFNANVSAIELAWIDVDTKRPLGHIHYGDVNSASIGYCLKYMSKVGRIPYHSNDDRLPEFAHMSKGLGQNYLTDAVSHWHKADLVNRMHLVLLDGKKVAMPRYYKDKLYDDNERESIAKVGAENAIKNEFEIDQKGFETYGNNWPSIKGQIVKQKFQTMANDAKGRNKI